MKQADSKTWRWIIGKITRNSTRINRQNELMEDVIKRLDKTETIENELIKLMAVHNQTIVRLTEISEFLKELKKECVENK